MENDKLNILMEYGGDCNLKKFIETYKEKNQLIEENIMKDIIIQMCKALKTIHENNIIHRDLTPENIFINENKKIKIGDFGISKILTMSNKYTKSIVGKIQYFAPEIIKGQKYNNKVDMYSLGCIIYELFTLNEYYIDKTIEEKECKIDIKIYNPKYQNLIDLLLKKDYHERPNAEQIIYLIEDNYIISEINTKEEDINKDMRLINSFENVNPDWIDKKDYNKYENEKEIKENCEIEINNKNIGFIYNYKFKEKGKYIIKYIFRNIITKTDFMFYGCKSLKNIDLSNFKTKNISNMGHMFDGCESLTNIDLSHINTQKVTIMEGMFSGCKSLTNVDLSNFNTQNVANMECIFNGCIKLEDNKKKDLNKIKIKEEETTEKDESNKELNKNIIEEKIEKNEAKKENNFLLNIVSEHLEELKDLFKDLFISIICKECGNIFINKIELGKLVIVNMMIDNKILANCDKCEKNSYGVDIPYNFNMKCKNCGNKYFEEALPFSALEIILTLRDNFKDCEICGKNDFIIF